MRSEASIESERSPNTRRLPLPVLNAKSNLQGSDSGSNVEALTQSDLTKSSTRCPAYQPAVLIFLAFGMGIGLDRWLDVPGLISLLASLACLVGWWFLSRNSLRCSRRISNERNRWFELCLTVLLLGGLVFAGAFWHHGRWNWFGVNEIRHFAGQDAKPCCIEADVVSEPKWSVATNEFVSRSSDEAAEVVRTRFTLKVRRIRDGQSWRAASGMLDLLIHEKTDHIRSGNRIVVFGKLVASSPPTNPGQFDFENFYRAKSRLAFLHAYNKDSVSVVHPAKGTMLGSWTGARLLSSLRQKLNVMTWRYVGEYEAPFASAIMLGNREQLSRERRDAFLETGTVHLLAISGLHVGILAGAFFLFFRVGLLSRRKCLWATILFVVFYAWLVEFRPPASRAAILVTLFCVGRLLGENSFSFNLLAIAGLIVLILNPSDLFGLGPQLSFLAVGTLTFGKDWIFWAPSKDPIKRLIASTRAWPQRIVNWLGKQLRTAVLVSGLIWLVAMPLVAFRFHLLSPVALIVNPLLLVPIAWSLYGGLGVLVSGWFLPVVARGFGYFCDRNLAFIEWMIGGAQSIPCSHFWTAGPTSFAVITFYAGLFLFAIFPLTKLSGRKLIVLFCIWVTAGWVIPDQVAQRLSANRTLPLECTFVDVGHGTCVLIQLPNGETMLYDAGSFGASDYGARNISGVLWFERIEHIDTVVLSHADVDHFNAMMDLSEKFSFGRVLLSQTMLESDSYDVRELLNRLKSLGVVVETVSAGDELASDCLFSISVLGPPSQGITGNDNSNSVVLLIEHLGYRILLPGDLEQAGLSFLFENPAIDCDLVMAAHHGSKHSEPEKFMAWSNPEYVVISGGSQRVTQESVDRFTENDTNRRIARTDQDGAIKIRFDKDGIEMKKWNDKAWR
jgi:competence protein ComEC